MPMKVHAIYFLLLLLIITCIVACKRNDDEPLLPPTRISRLYVSFSDVQTDDLAQPYTNVAVFDPADSIAFDRPDYFNSQVMEGAGIFFSPSAKRVFQGSVQNFMIKTFSISAAGVLGPATSFIDSTLTSQPDLAYDPLSTNLYVTNNLTNSIHVYANGTQRNGILKYGPNKRFELSSQPRGLVLDNDSIMVVLRTSTDVNQIALLENPSKIDSGIVNPLKKITVPGASDLRGIAYSRKLNLLVVSDLGSSKVFIIENARDAFTQSLTITPDQSISGNLTGIINPIDVAIDDRDDKMFLYIVDRGNKKEVLRFKLSDRGNIAPNAFYTFDLTPASIYLDAR